MSSVPVSEQIKAINQQLDDIRANMLLPEDVTTIVAGTIVDQRLDGVATRMDATERITSANQDAISDINRWRHSIEGSLRDIRDAVESLQDGLTALSDSTSSSIADIQTTLNTMHETYKKIHTRIDYLEDETATAKTARREIRVAISDLSSVVNEVKAGLVSLTQSIPAFTELSRSTMQQAQDARAEIDALEADTRTNRAEIDDLRERYQLQDIEIGNRWQALSEKIEAWENRVGETVDAFRKPRNWILVGIASYFIGQAVLVAADRLPILQLILGG